MLPEEIPFFQLKDVKIWLETICQEMGYSLHMNFYEGKIKKEMLGREILILPTYVKSVNRLQAETPKDFFNSRLFQGRLYYLLILCLENVILLVINNESVDLDVLKKRSGLEHVILWVTELENQSVDYNPANQLKEILENHLQTRPKPVPEQTNYSLARHSAESHCNRRGKNFVLVKDYDLEFLDPIFEEIAKRLKISFEFQALDKYVPYDDCDHIIICLNQWSRLTENRQQRVQTLFKLLRKLF